MFNLKKIIVGTLLAGVAGVLIFGAINRTQAKTLDQSFDGTNRNEIRQQQSFSIESAGKGQNHFIQPSLQNEDGTQYRKFLNQTKNGCKITPRNESSDENRKGFNQGSSTSGNGYRGGKQNRTSSNSPLNGNEQNLAKDKFNEIINSQGEITNIGEEKIVIETTTGNEIVIEGRALSFAIEQNFSASVHDKLFLRGFFEADDFEIISIENLTSGQEITPREDSGRPLWAGRAGRN